MLMNCQQVCNATRFCKSSWGSDEWTEQSRFIARYVEYGSKTTGWCIMLSWVHLCHHFKKNTWPRWISHHHLSSSQREETLVLSTQMKKKKKKKSLYFICPVYWPNRYQSTGHLEHICEVTWTGALGDKGLVPREMQSIALVVIANVPGCQRDPSQAVGGPLIVEPEMNQTYGSRQKT